jgi:hypothetical protein
MIRSLLFASAVLLVDPTAVHAGRNCGGGGGHSGGDGRGESSSNTAVNVSNGTSWSYVPTSDSSGVAAETTATCSDDTDVVGYRKCTKFGGWGMSTRLPRVFLELGSNMRQFANSIGTREGTVHHGAESFTYKMVMPAGAPPDSAITSAIRVGVGLPHGLYAGVEGELGGIVQPAAANAEMSTSAGTFGSPNIDTKTSMVVGAYAIAGIRGGTRRGSVALEGAGGVRAVNYRFNSSYHHCEEITTINVVRGVVEARARAEVWLLPWITAGATLGANVTALDDWMAGLYLGVHNRTFGGRR